jgi:hypothetical protein
LGNETKLTVRKLPARVGIQVLPSCQLKKSQSVSLRHDAPGFFVPVCLRLSGTTDIKDAVL